MFGLFGYNEKKCASEVISALTQHELDETPLYDPDKRSVKCGEMTIFLGNIFNKAKTLNKQDRLEYIESFVASSVEEFSFSYEDSANLLVPRLKTIGANGIRELYLKSQQDDYATIPSIPFTDRFCFELGIDANNAIRVVTEDNLETMKLSVSEAMSIAKKNLYSISQSPFAELKENLYMCQYDDDHDSARILLEEEIRALNVKGKPIAFAPSPAVLLICGHEDFESINSMQGIIEQAIEGHRPLSLAPLILEEDGWQDFIPPYTNEYAAIHNLILIDDMETYNEQKGILEETLGEDIFVATYSLFGNEETPHYHSVSTWSETVPTWLPKTKNIHLVKWENDEPNPIGEISFDDALSHLSNYFKPLDTNPERYEVVDFPSDEELSSILKS